MDSWGGFLMVLENRAPAKYLHFECDARQSGSLSTRKVLHSFDCIPPLHRWTVFDFSCFLDVPYSCRHCLLEFTYLYKEIKWLYYHHTYRQVLCLLTQSVSASQCTDPIPVHFRLSSSPKLKRHLSDEELKDNGLDSVNPARRESHDPPIDEGIITDLHWPRPI